MEIRFKMTDVANRSEQQICSLECIASFCLIPCPAHATQESSDDVDRL